MAHTSHIHTGEIAKPNTAAIWRTFYILLAITALEFIVALAIPETIISHGIKVAIYIFLTVVKAGYIVGEFMHLGHEAKFLLWAIITPMLFIVWLLAAIIWESGSSFNHQQNVKQKPKPKTSMMIYPTQEGNRLS